MFAIYAIERMYLALLDKFLVLFFLIFISFY